MKTFYDREFSQDTYAAKISDHTHHPILGSFIEQYHLENSPVLEVGCGRGAFQDLVAALRRGGFIGARGPIFAQALLLRQRNCLAVSRQLL